MSKEKKKSGIKKFFEEFKVFITRGNVLDMSVGVIVGGAFTGIVNGLSNYILKPIINWLLAMVLGTDGLEGAVTFLSKVMTTDANGAQIVDLANSIYIDWGAFVSAIINFLLIAFVLFSIVKVMNSLAAERDKMINNPEWSKKKEIAKIRIEEKVSKKEAKAIYAKRQEEAAAKAAEEARLAEEAAAAAKAAEEERATANTRLLEEIRDLLKQNYAK